MASPHRPASMALILAVVAVTLMVLGPAGSGAATRQCGAFSSQADAQVYFVELGGGPRTRVGRLDADRDGVACEHLSGPYQGFAGLGYNKRKDFFYGYAWMPSVASGEGFACMFGNKHVPDGPRRLNVYRVTPDGDKPLRTRKFGVGAEANPETGRLTWKLNAGNPRGAYYMAFEERIALTPYGRNECPGFRSRTITLPEPEKSAPAPGR
jgi:hypothetical protein